MTTLWHFYWPVFMVGMLIGLFAGIASFRRPGNEQRRLLLGAGSVAALVLAALWHGPGGAGDGLSRTLERSARIALRKYEMDRVSVRIEQEPLRRNLVLSGPADDFQQRELVRILGALPGVSSVRWDRPMAPSKGL